MDCPWRTSLPPTTITKSYEAENSGVPGSAFLWPKPGARLYDPTLTSNSLRFMLGCHDTRLRRSRFSRLLLLQPIRKSGSHAEHLRSRFAAGFFRVRGVLDTIRSPTLTS